MEFLIIVKYICNKKIKKKDGKPISLIINNSVFLKKQQCFRYSPSKNNNKNFVNKSINLDKNRKVFKIIKNQYNGVQINKSNNSIIRTISMNKEFNATKMKKLFSLSNSMIVKENIKPSKINNNTYKFVKFPNRSTCFNYK